MTLLNKLTKAGAVGVLGLGLAGCAQNYYADGYAPGQITNIRPVTPPNVGPVAPPQVRKPEPPKINAPNLFYFHNKAVSEGISYALWMQRLLFNR